MRSIIIVFFFVVCIEGHTNAQPAAESTYKAQVGRMLKKSDASTYTIKYFSDVAKYTFGNTSGADKWESKYQQSIRAANTNADRLAADFQKIISKSRENVDKERIVFKTVEYSGRIIMSPIESIPIWGPIQKEINNQIFEAADNELTNNYRKRLAYSLEKIRVTDQVKYNSIIKSGNYEEVKQALTEVNYFSNAAFTDVGPEYQEIIEKSQQKFLQESVKSTLERVVTDLGNQQIEIDNVNARISKLSQFTYRFAAESDRRFDNLMQSQLQLNTKVEQFYKAYQTDKKALDFMQDYLYSKMNTTEKIQALQSGLLSNLPASERKMITDELVLEQEKEKVLNTAKDFLNTAAISMKILGDLGLGDSQLAQDISQGINIGQTAVTAVAAFTSGNYLECISSITGLFGKKGDDAAAQRHKQIMQRFDRIDATLDRIESKMDILLEGQKKIFELQVSTFNKLLDLSDKIDEQHNAVMSRLSTIEHALYENRKLIMDAWEAKCQACLQTIRRLEMNIDQNILPTPEKLKAAYPNLKQGYFQKCEDYINTYVFYDDQPSFNPDFNLTSFIDNVNIATAYRKLDTINKVSFNLLFGYNKPVEKIKTPDQLLLSLFFPSASISELNQKIQADTILFNTGLYPTMPGLFSNVIKPEVSERHGYVVRNIGFLQSLTDGDRNLISWNQFTSENPPGQRDARYELENAMRLNNVAIAQQSILAGDILLPLIFKESYNYHAGTGDTLRFKVCESLLTMNELLAYNYTNYFISTYLSRSNQSEMQYAYAFNSRDSLVMSQVIKSSFPVDYIDTADARLAIRNQNPGWYLCIGEFLYPLPNPSQVNKIPLNQSQYLEGLLRNREKLLQHIFSFKSYEPGTPESLNYLILKNE